HDVTVEVRTWGRFQREATLICHALTGSADADEWWGGLFGKDRLFDPSDSFIVSMNVLGSCYGTTGPTSLSEPSDFPEITIRDMVHLQKAALDQLGIAHLDLVIGGSMGGMQVLEWAVLYPSFVGTIIPIGVGSSQSAWAIGISEAQRSSILNASTPSEGLATARIIAMCSYRSPMSFQSRFGRESDNGVFTAQTYLRYQGEKLVERFDANTYLTLLGAMDSHDLGRGRGPREAILNRIKHRALVVGTSTDVLYPVSETRTMAASMPNAEFAVLDSPNGHDAFLIETDKLERIVATFLEDSRPLSAARGQGAAWV
ncbi:MAG: homoserine O-acetyltransferase, partial [Actinomycetia bacterium]|nr:homoserine O-acetyltransferase [Actinomycetes bacterium]